MVRLQGIVWDGEKTTSNYPYYLSGVVLTQGSGWSATTNGSGYFSTSANTTLNSLTVNTSGYRSVTISVPIFATHYDGSFVISGSLTQDATVSNGYAFITDNQKTFFANSLSGRILTIHGGIDDGDTGIIVGNTPNTILVGGVSGASSGTIITGATSGNIYNIGGVSSEPTNQIVITLWENAWYT